MKKLIISVGLIASLHAFAAPQKPSPYITTCEQPECQAQAVAVSFEPISKEGVRVYLNNTFSMVVDQSVESLIHHRDILVFLLPDEARIGVSTLSPNDYGLDASLISGDELLNLAFIEKFSELSEQLAPQERHAIRAIKLDAMRGDNAYKLYNALLRIYFFSDSETHHKAHVVLGENASSWIMVDFFGMSRDRAKDILLTIKEI